MAPKITNNYFNNVKARYLKSTKEEKTKILNEFIKGTGFNRKYVIRIFNKLVKEGEKKTVRKKKYDDPAILVILKNIWKQLNLPCSKRLKSVITIWIPFYEKHFGKIPENEKKLLGSISDRTIDRLFSGFRKRYKKGGQCTTKPGSKLKRRILVKTNQWDEKRPGYLEVDTVAHCGGFIGGTFVYTLDVVDIATQWTTQRAVWGKGGMGVLNAIKTIIKALPFKVLGIDSDNGLEFINDLLYDFLTKRKSPIQFTRSREYHKNDNAHIESKNWSIVRQYLGYQRFDDKNIVDLLNDLYKNEFYLYLNYFVPCFKLIDKTRNGSKIIKTYDKPKTPYQRVLESEHISNNTKKSLERIYSKLDPIDLQSIIRAKINRIINLAKPL
jgi:hypothetical protein